MPLRVSVYVRVSGAAKLLENLWMQCLKARLEEVFAKLIMFNMVSVFCQNSNNDQTWLLLLDFSFE